MQGRLIYMSLRSLFNKIDLQALFDKAFQHAERGENQEAARVYEAFLDAVQGPRSGVSPAQRPQLIRSAAFNLAQVLNKLKDYQKALAMVDLGLSHSPSEYGRAIALAARGEALCGLQRDTEGMMAFKEAMRAHPVVGRLNAADAMTRLGSTAYLQLADEWVNTVLSTLGHLLDDRLYDEAHGIRREIVRLRAQAGETSAATPPTPAASSTHEAQRHLHHALTAARQAATLAEAIAALEKAMTLDPALCSEYAGLLRQWKMGIVM
jgi:tetratricopeptide (TPR) repeat protein